ncbi:TonB-dependent receptor plug domain-containing protein [Halonatronum saccharophilum]|uniref:TonB-dependent receptor plug domain-containing protein n=1 Tax=Halonatronum saccharophilum TaxID=150060 RepID=UPI00048471A3|nr:TonB-dependent receptor [Halonatronum saccharophilum]
MKKLTIIFTLIFNLLAVSNVLAEEVEESFFIFEEVVVTASRYEELLSETFTSIEIIREEEIRERSVENVGDLLRDVSGVNINDNAGASGVKTISIRGSASEQVLVLIDGQPINEVQGGGIDLSLIPIEQIERIEVLKGPASAIYGANALGGVVNIITKRGTLDSQTTIKAGFASFDTQSYNLSHYNQQGDLGYSLNLNKKSSDGHRENSDLDQKNLFVRFDYPLSDSIDTRLSIQYDKADKGVPGSIQSASPKARQNDELLNLNFQGKRRTDNSDFKLTLHWRSDERDYKDPTWSTDDNHKRRRKGVNFNHRFYLQDHTIVYGLDLEEQKVDSTAYNEIYQLTNQAAFIQNKWSLTDDFIFNLGTRYDRHEEYGSNLSPRVGFLYNLNSNLSWYSSVGKAYRAPTFDDLYWPDSGNPDLNSEISKSYESGLRYIGDKTKLDFGVFYSHMDDMIAWVPNPTDENPWRWTPDNIDSAKIKGIELSFDKDLSGSLYSNFNYTYLDARDGDKERLANRPYHRANLGLSYNNKGTIVNLSNRLVVGRKDLPSYYLADFKILRELTSNAEIFFGVNNLFDREYEVQAGYPMPERNYKVELIKRF